MQLKFYLGLDFGTSGARACVVDVGQNIAWEHCVTYPDAATQTHLDWRNALHTLLSAMPKTIASELHGLAIDATSATVLLCDAQLDAVSPALLYHDDRAQQQAEQIKSIAPPHHVVCTATSGLAKFLWFTQQNYCEHAAYFMHQADYLSALLSGKPGISDYHNALKTGYDVEHLCWPDWVMALPSAHLLPRVLAPGAIIGPIQPGIAAHFGINPHCVVHVGSTDSNAAFIAAGAGVVGVGVVGVGVGVTTLGTTLVVKQLSAQRIEAPEYGVYSHRFGDLWLVGGASNAGGGVLRNYFDDAQLAALSAQIDPLQDSPLDYYPLPRRGERFPVNDAQLAPRLTPRPASDVEFLHGLLQGLARIEAAAYTRLAELGAPPLERVVTCGGGANNVVWRQMRERLLGVPVAAAVHTDAAYGSALLAVGCNSIAPYSPRSSRSRHSR